MDDDVFDFGFIDEGISLWKYLVVELGGDDGVCDVGDGYFICVEFFEKCGVL